MFKSKKVVVFADSFVGLEITKFLTENFFDDIIHVVVENENSEIMKFVSNKGIASSVFGSEKYENFISSNDFDVGFLIWWPKIIPERLIKKAKDGFINTHPSFLPFSRGKHYNFWTIVEDSKFGVTLHYVDEGIDSGDIIFQREIDYDWLDNGKSLFDKARQEMINMFQEFYPLYRENKIHRKTQDLEKGTYHNSSELDKFSKLDLDGNYVLKDLLNMLRGRTFEGHPACFFEDPKTNKTYEVRVRISEKFNK